jgi:hypothetical protein
MTIELKRTEKDKNMRGIKEIRVQNRYSIF